MSKKKRRKWAYGIAATGAAITGGALGVRKAIAPYRGPGEVSYVYNQGTKPDWSDEFVIHKNRPAARSRWGNLMDRFMGWSGPENVTPKARPSIAGSNKALGHEFSFDMQNGRVAGDLHVSKLREYNGRKTGLALNFKLDSTPLTKQLQKRKNEIKKSLKLVDRRHWHAYDEALDDTFAAVEKHVRKRPSFRLARLARKLSKAL